MYLNIGGGNALGLGNVGGFIGIYWSSSEYNLNFAWVENGGDGSVTLPDKHFTYSVRAIRAF